MYEVYAENDAAEYGMPYLRSTYADAAKLARRLAAKFPYVEIYDATAPDSAPRLVAILK
jgi:hypothetical protein